MRARVEIDDYSSILRLELDGEPGPGNLSAFAAEVASRSGFEHGMHVLIDARGITNYPSDQTIAELAGAYRALWLTGEVGCTAIVIQRDGFRAARAFQIHSGDGDPRLAVFRNPDDATRWLASVRSNRLQCRLA